VTEKQRDFDVQPVVADRSAAPFGCALHPIFDRVEMEVQFSAAALKLEPLRRKTRSVSRRRSSLSVQHASGPSTAVTHTRAAPTVPPSSAAVDRPGSSNAVARCAFEPDAIATVRASCAC